MNSMSPVFMCHAAFCFLIAFIVDRYKNYALEETYSNSNQKISVV